VARSSARFMWSNKQHNLVRCVLDRALVSPEWEMQFSVSTLIAVTSIGLHYTPLLLDTGAGLPNRPNKFFFETNWFELQGFKAMVEEWWEENSRGVTHCRPSGVVAFKI
jgi:hypothetical protein